MTQQSDPPESDLDWLNAVSENETFTETAARGGALSEPDRRAAIASALPLLGIYFASGNQPLHVMPAVSELGGVEVVEVLWGIRFRVALAVAARLRGILTRIVDRPTFRYQLTEAESTGDLAGQIDINRYITKAGPTAETPIYPIKTVRRIQNTPENVLAVYAAVWVLRELKESFAKSGAGKHGPEAREQALQRRAIEHVLKLPGLADCIPAAMQVNRAHVEQGLVRQVVTRLRRREVANESPYRELVSWVQNSLHGNPAAQSGEIEWSFYGERFDTKLFELWCFQQLAIEISRLLSVELPPLNSAWRAGAAAYIWDRPAGVLKLHFQQALSTISTRQARWRRVDGDNKALGGVPDITVNATRRFDGQERLAIIDPKLRQRGGAPAEELYKILGYFDNFGLSSEPFGAILYYSPSSTGGHRYSYAVPGQIGELHAVSLNPAGRSSASLAIRPVARMLLRLLNIEPVDDEVADADSLDPDSRIEGSVRARLHELEALSRSLPVNVLDSSRRRVRAMIGDERWSIIPDDVGTMLATSEYVGFSLDSTGDFSGPVIGICASIEVLLHDMVITPAVRDTPRLGNSCKTFGQAIHATQEALSSDRDPLHRAIGTRLREMQVDIVAMRGILERMADINTKYRIPAAHRELVTDLKWRAAWSAIVGPGNLLSDTVDILG